MIFTQGGEGREEAKRQPGELARVSEGNPSLTYIVQLLDSDLPHILRTGSIKIVSDSAI